MSEYFIEGSVLQEPDELVNINNNVYAVYMYTTTGGAVMPLVVNVDLPKSFQEGAIDKATVYTEETFADKYGYAFFSMFNLSDLKLIDPENRETTDIDFLLENVENDLERKATSFGKEWYLDDEVQQLFAYGAITGEDISPYLENLTWFKDHNATQREWITLVYNNPEKAQELINNNYIAFRTQISQLGISGSGVDDLTRQLAGDIAQGNIDSAEASQILSYLIDPYKLAMAGGEDALNESYRGFVDKINPSKSGVADAKSLITKYLGVDAAQEFAKNGIVEQYAAMLRADAELGEGVNVNRETIIEQLQTAHDKLFPQFAGSQHEMWSAPMYRSFQAITGKSALSNTDKKNVDIITQKTGGDMTLFSGEIRKQYEDDPTYADQVLGGMASVFRQDVSGVFTGQSLVG
jgi:hypothetical protein